MKAILTYHSIDASGSPISVTPAVFDEHVRWLESGRVPVIALGDMVSSAANAAVAITFDDGFANVVAPIVRLREAGLPVTVFVVSGEVGRTNAWGGESDPRVPTLPLATWTDLERLVAAGVSIEAHTRSHPSLSPLDGTRLDEELEGCQMDLRTRLGVTARHVAYPFGDVTPAVAERARRFYGCGYTTVYEPVTSRHDALLLPRIDMYYWRAPGAITSWSDPAGHVRHWAIGARRLARHALLGGPSPGGGRRWSR